MLLTEFGSVLVERASAFVKSLVVRSHKVLRHGAHRGVNFASSKRVNRCRAFAWDSCLLDRRVCPLNVGRFDLVHWFGFVLCEQTSACVRI